MRKLVRFFAQHGALAHAEAVLLVRDDEAKRLKNRRLRKERMRADDEIELAGGQLFLHLAPLRGAKSGA